MVAETEKIDFLFRFRDLVAETVVEHRKIITEHGACWWGWWKRPSEDNRHEIWTQLEAAIQGRGPQKIGLFDSGRNQVRLATVVQIVKPDSDADLVDIPDRKDDELIPSYYRQSPFSRAWMKLTKIGEPIDFFGKYSYAEAPSLPNYTPVTLAKFKGKVILSAEELRGMDTTIWKIRPTIDNDSKQSLILGVPALPAAITEEPVKCNSNLALHITDPHFTKGEKFRLQHVWRLESETDNDERPVLTASSLADALFRALKGRTIGLIVVTGDLTFVGSQEEYEEAHTFFTRLLGLFNLSSDHLVIIPGNHDIQWGTEDVYDDAAVVKAAPTKAKENYRKFYREFFHHEPSAYLAMGRRFLLPSGLTLEICALNSSSLNTGKNFLAGMGRIEPESFAEVKNGLGWANERTLALRILAVHHHLALTENLEESSGYSHGFGIAVDAVKIQRLAAAHGVQLALHGHKHRAFIWRSSIYELPEQPTRQHKHGDLSIIGGGSAGSSDTPGGNNYFNILNFDSTELSLEIWRSEQTGEFTVMKTWRAALGIDSDKKKLILSDWFE